MVYASRQSTITTKAWPEVVMKKLKDEKELVKKALEEGMK
ncbi:MAG: hypothetical protein ACI868_001526, partial [Granulosicoccus sp.]